MDYVVGSVAALISGNVTPSRPKLIKRALTPTKHPQSPNVTPKSEFGADRSIFLSPTLQKKKAIVKKSPKRIFQNPDIDTTFDEGNNNLTSPVVDKVKKHLTDQLETVNPQTVNMANTKSPKNKHNKPKESISPIKIASEDTLVSNVHKSNENTLKKKIRKSLSIEAVMDESPHNPAHVSTNVTQNVPGTKTPMKRKRSKSTNEKIEVEEKENLKSSENTDNVNKEVKKVENTTENTSTTLKKKKNKRRINKSKTNKVKESESNKSEESKPENEIEKNADLSTKVTQGLTDKISPKKSKSSKSTPETKEVEKNENQKSSENTDSYVNKEAKTCDNTTETNNTIKSKKNKKRKKKSVTNQAEKESQSSKLEESKSDNENEGPVAKKFKSKKKSKKESNQPDANQEEVTVNPNAITSQDTDSEHESDDEIQSEDENKEALEAGPAESSDEEEEQKPNKKQKVTTDEPREQHVATEDEIKRTLFVGNVPFSKKCKKEVKKLFSKYGDIETVRIRTIPVKDASVTPKLAVIKNELHPERTTVNVYIKYKQADSVDRALSANNTVMDDHHLRVSRSDTSGSVHDPKCAVFVGNMPFALEDETLRAKFQGCGEIESVRIVRDKKTNAGKGFGYVNFASKDGVELALALTEEDLTIKNRIMRVKRCNQWQKSGQKVSNARGNMSNVRGNGSNFRGNASNFRGNSSNFRGNGPSIRGNGSNFRGNGSNFRGNGSNFRGNGSNFRGNGSNFRGNTRGSRGNGSNFRGNTRGNRGNVSNPRNFDKNATEQEETGAFRRIMNKRKFQEGGDGSNNNERTNEPPREKKPRKEFVGMTGEKKKKQKFNKGQKKKKALSEILTK